MHTYTGTDWSFQHSTMAGDSIQGWLAMNTSALGQLVSAGLGVCGTLHWTVWIRYTTEITYCPLLPSANEVCEGYVFIRVCHSVRGGGSPDPYPGGGWGSGRGGLQAQVGGVSQHALKQTPPSRRLLLQTVHILLECILVSECNQILFATGLLHFLTGRAS